MTLPWPGLANTSQFYFSGSNQAMAAGLNPLHRSVNWSDSFNLLARRSSGLCCRFIESKAFLFGVLGFMKLLTGVQPSERSAVTSGRIATELFSMRGLRLVCGAMGWNSWGWILESPSNAKQELIWRLNRIRIRIQLNVKYIDTCFLLGELWHRSSVSLQLKFYPILANYTLLPHTTCTYFRTAKPVQCAKQFICFKGGNEQWMFHYLKWLTFGLSE